MHLGKVTLAAALLLTALTSPAHPQVIPTNTVGIPISPVGNPVSGTATLILQQYGYENQVNPVGQGDWPFTMAFAGDRVLVNGTGGNDPSNWLAVERFFNPADPTGSLGLPATLTQAYFARDVGAGGFAAFKLFPKVNYTNSSVDQFGRVLGSDSLFGPVGGVHAGQLAILLFGALPAAPTAVPEPGLGALATGLSVAGSVFAFQRRRLRR